MVVNRKKSSRTACKSSQIICSEMKIMLKSLVSRKTIVQKENIKIQISVITARENSVNNESTVKNKTAGSVRPTGPLAQRDSCDCDVHGNTLGFKIPFLPFFSSTFFFCRLSQSFWYLLYLKIIKYSLCQVTASS